MKGGAPKMETHPPTQLATAVGIQVTCRQNGRILVGYNFYIEEIRVGILKGFALP